MTDILVQHDGPIATVVINRPAMRNAISLAMWTELARVTEELGKKDVVANLNFFMNVPVAPDGAMAIVDGLSKPGDYVDLRAEMEVLAVISNCPQTRNPCNGFNPTPIRLIVTDPT